MKKNLILFLILLCNCTFLYAQQFNITGVVTVSYTHLTLPTKA